MVPFAIEFKSSAWVAGVVGANPNALPSTYRVLLSLGQARAFISTTEDFGGWTRVVGQVDRAISPLSEHEIVALALRGYHGWWMNLAVPPPADWGKHAENGVQIFHIGTIKREG